VGHPAPGNQKARTRLVRKGSNSNGTTVIGPSSGSSGCANAVVASGTRPAKSNALGSQSGGWTGALRSARGTTDGREAVGAAARSQATPKRNIAGYMRTAAALWSVRIAV